MKNTSKNHLRRRERFLLFSDSMCRYGDFSKKRYDSQKLFRSTSWLTAELLCSERSVSWRWIASERNAIDASSRVWESFRDFKERDIDENRFDGPRDARAERDATDGWFSDWRVSGEEYRIQLVGRSAWAICKARYLLALWTLLRTIPSYIEQGRYQLSVDPLNEKRVRSRTRLSQHDSRPYDSMGETSMLKIMDDDDFFCIFLILTHHRN